MHFLVCLFHIATIVILIFICTARETTTCIDHAIFAPEAQHFYTPFGAKMSSFFLMAPSWLLDMILTPRKLAGKAGVTARSLDLGSFSADPKK